MVYCDQIQKEGFPVKKFAAIALLTAMLCSLLCLTGCSPKTAITPEEFRTTMEAAGYIVFDATSQLNDAPHITTAYVAFHGDDEYRIEFYVTDSAEYAKYLFDDNKLAFERSTDGAASHLSVNLLNSNSFKMTTNDQYRVLSRIDNTMIYIKAPEQFKPEINEVLKSLGY